jgi:hypothetical protein
VLAEGTVAELIELAGDQPRMEIKFLKEPIGEWLDGIVQRGGEGVINDGAVTIRIASMAAVSEVLDRARAAGGEVSEFAVHNPNLSDAFIALTGRGLRDPERHGH